jgi:hypothetical protein
MNSSELLSRQGRCLLQLGIVLFLFTSFEGFVIPTLAVPNLGRSVHTLSGFTGILFLATGLMWPMLKLGMTGARFALCRYRCPCTDPLGAAGPISLDTSHLNICHDTRKGDETSRNVGKSSCVSSIMNVNHAKSGVLA